MEYRKFAHFSLLACSGCGSKSEISRFPLKKSTHSGGVKCHANPVTIVSPQERGCLLQCGHNKFEDKRAPGPAPVALSKSSQTEVPSLRLVWLFAFCTRKPARIGILRVFCASAMGLVIQKIAPSSRIRATAAGFGGTQRYPDDRVSLHSGHHIGLYFSLRAGTIQRSALPPPAEILSK